MSAQGPDDLRAVHAARRELGPDYDDALLESFVDRAEAQVRRRLATGQPPTERVAEPSRQPLHLTLGPGGLMLALLNGVWGVFSSLLLASGYDDNVAGVLIVWIVIALSDAAYLGANIAGRTAERRKQAPSIDAPARRPAPRPNPSRSSTT